jgi:glycosyltransferase involved in cell wall biosynthesis
MPETAPKLSVVVAAYNEEPVIRRNLERIVQSLASQEACTWELVCVDDGSTDRTGELMDDFAAGSDRIRVLHHRRNFGQGRALRTAFDAARGEVIVTLDADLSYGPEYIVKLADALAEQNAEIALASPYMPGGRVENVPFHRRFLSRLGNRYLARMSHYRISTSTCAVRAYRREVLDAIALTSDGMELQLEVLMKAAMRRFRVCEVPADLVWAKEKAAEAGFRRASKMRILQTIRLYLLMGWLSRPAMVFAVVSALLLLPGLYMAGVLGVRFVQFTIAALDRGLVQALSDGLNRVFATYTYSVVFCGAFLLIGFQTLAFSLLVMQNKFYFDELCRLSWQGRRGEAPTRPPGDRQAGAGDR